MTRKGAEPEPDPTPDPEAVASVDVQRLARKSQQVERSGLPIFQPQTNTKAEQAQCEEAEEGSGKGSGKGQRVTRAWTKVWQCYLLVAMLSNRKGFRVWG